MKKILIAAAAATMMLGAVAAHAEGTMGGLGFRTLSGPGIGLPVSGNSLGASPSIGIRQWFSEKAGVDVAVGFSTATGEFDGTTFESGTAWAVDIGVPFVVKKWDKVNFIARPGARFGSVKGKDETVTPNIEETWTSMAFSGELEVEYMLAEKLSVSASHGLAFGSIKNDATKETKFTGFSTTGDNFTQLGFHVYLW